MSRVLAHRSIEQPLYLPRLLALPLPDHLTVDLEGLVGLLEYYEYCADRQRRADASEAARLSYTGEFDLFPEWNDEATLSHEKAEGSQ